MQSYVMVLQPEQPVITITGTQTLAKEYEDFQNGASLFSTINIYMADTEEELSESFESNGLFSLLNPFDFAFAFLTRTFAFLLWVSNFSLNVECPQASILKGVNGPLVLST